MLVLPLFAALCIAAALGSKYLLNHPERTLAASGIRFSPALELALLVPVAISVTCALIAKSIDFGYCSPWPARFFYAILSCGCVALLVVPVSLVLLIRTPSLRSLRNWLLMTMATTLLALLVVGLVVDIVLHAIA